MFPKKDRLSREDFPLVGTSGRRINSPHFSIIVTNDRNDVKAGHSGYAVVIPKKVARLSVTRHRIKRRVVAALRTLPLPRSLIVFPKATVQEIDSRSIKAELTELLSKISK